MLHLVHSNHLEQLAKDFSDNISSATVKLSPFKSELVVVQNAGMGRWLSLQTAKHTGIAANMRYLFPAELTWELLRAVLLDDVPERDPCSPKLLRWRLLDELLAHPQRYPELNHYLRDGQNDAAWQLARQIASVFDGYLFFRPEWIRLWESGEANVEGDWQVRLWRNVIHKQQLEHWVRLQQRFLETLARTVPESLPKRIHFFSVPALSPAYIELIAKVAEHTDIYFYVMNPSDQYWGDLESAKRKLRYSPDEQGYISVGNPLLAAWGRQGRDFIENLRDVDPYPAEDERFIQKNNDVMLHRVQDDILDLLGEEAEARLPVALEADQSIRFHACHSPMREVEVLYDQLLAAFERDSALTPADIVVMSPDIDGYAPFIDAVFASADVRLPYSIADQRMRYGQNVVAVTLLLLDLPQSQFEAEAVFALLEYDEVCQHFGLDDEQVQQCRDWVRATNIRWGIDAAARPHCETAEHTWRYGLDRLLLGYAMPGDELFADVLPFDDIEGSQALILGRLQQFLDVVFPLAAWSKTQHSLLEWSQQMMTLLNELLPDDAETNNVYQALEALREAQRQAEFERPVAWNVFRDALKTQLEQRNQAEGFMGRGITFCTLMPMRSVPFKVVALLGMQDGDFPRRDTRLSFDKLAHDRKKRGDRSRRDEDRYLFLESVLSARQQLYISYVGQSIQDNSPMMPSVLVSELQDYLEQRFAVTTDDLTTHHPLQAFSPRYFTEDDLFTYNTANANLLQGEKHGEQAFWQGEVLPELDERYRYVMLADLISFYRQPARYFLRHRFDLVLREDEAGLPEREPFALEAFVDNDIRQQLFAQIQQGVAPDTSLALLRAQGLLPHGKPGDLVYANEHERVATFIAELPELTTTSSHKTHVKVAEFELSGELQGLSADGMQLFHFGKLSAWQWVDVWLRHLLLSAAPDLPQGIVRESRLLTPDGSWHFTYVPNAAKHVERLLVDYWQGLHEPLPFLPKSAWKMMEKDEISLRAALAEWQGSDRHAGEMTKPEHELLYRGCDPIVEQQDRFVALADGFFGTMKQYRTELS